MISPAALKKLVGDDFVLTDREQITSYLADETALAVRPRPAANVIVVKPQNSLEIAGVIKLANREKTPVFVRGGGTGLCGGAVPTRDGIVLSIERLNHILEVDRDNLMVVAEAGVTLGDLIKAVESAGFSFPPHPGDEGAQLGGLVACNAGGSRAVKHGVIRNYVKGLEVVLPQGDILSLGGKLLKNNQGLDLMHLLINSGGILGVITRVIFRLYPKSLASLTLVIAFESREDAVSCVPRILQSGVIPMALEYVEREVIETSAGYLGMKWPADKGEAFLIVILTGNSEDEVYSEAEQVNAICGENRARDSLVAERKEEQADILKIRSEIYSAMKAQSADILDITVPPATISVMMGKMDEVAGRFKTRIVMYGHAADGNLHAHLSNELWERGLLKEAKREIYREAIKLGGVITGEHGVGVIRIPELDLYPAEKGWELMRGIKKLFDPNNILNPGVGLP
ncbi:MAG: FAD-binding oxidoreductase [Chloroflexota bacterium]